MFDVGFGELCLVFVVALLVLGPDRMLEVSGLLGRAIRKIKTVTAELSKHVDVDVMAPDDDKAASR